MNGRVCGFEHISIVIVPLDSDPEAGVFRHFDRPVRGEGPHDVAVLVPDHHLGTVVDGDADTDHTTTIEDTTTTTFEDEVRASFVVTFSR